MLKNGFMNSTIMGSTMASMDNHKNSTEGVNLVNTTAVTECPERPNEVDVDSLTNAIDEGECNEVTSAADENVCPMCCEKKPAQDDEGHCSYECASGGGKSASNEVVQPIVFWQDRCQLCYKFPGACKCTEDDYYEAFLRGDFDEDGYVDSP